MWAWSSKKAISLFFSFSFFILIGCATPPAPTAQPTEVAQVTATNTAKATGTATSTVAPTETPTATIMPTETASETPPASPTQMPTPLPRVRDGISPVDPRPLLSQSMRFALPGIGTPYPKSDEVIRSENVSRLTELAMWGKGSIYRAAYSPDGARVYAVTSLGLTIYDAESAEQIGFVPLSDTVYAVAASPDGRSVALSINSSPPIVAIFDTQSLQPVEVLRYEGSRAAERLFYSADGGRLVVLDSWSQAWETESYRSILSTREPSGEADGEKVHTALYAEDSDQFFFVYDQALRVWGSDTARTGYRFERELSWEEPVYPPPAVYFMQFEISPDGRQLAVTDRSEGLVDLFDTASGEKTFSFVPFQRTEGRKCPYTQ